MSLHPEHLQDLQHSGLTAETITAMGVYSARPGDLDKLAGWGISAQGVTSAIVFPYPDCDGFYQLKVFPAIQNGDGHHVKYIQPKASESRAYILPEVRERLGDSAEGVLLAEGAKKAARLTQEGFNGVGIAAVWNWKCGGDLLPYTDPACVIPDVVRLVTPGRRVVVAFDSDVWEAKKQNCRLGLYALLRHLERLGARAYAVRLPGPTKQERAEGLTKLGADDFLSRHSPDDFRRLITEAIPPTHELFRSVAEQWRRRELATRPFAEPISTLLAEPDTAPDWIVDDLLALGDGGFIAAEPKLAKSWLMYLMALCLATGQSFLDFKVARQRKVLLMSEEDSRARLRWRLRRLLAGLSGCPPTDAWLRFTARTGFKLDSAEWLTRLREELASFRPDLVLLDVLRRLHDLDENSNQDMGKLTNILNELRRDFGCGFLIAHHNRKLTQGNAKRSRGGQEMSGAGVLHAWSEASLYLTKGSGKGKFIVAPEHKDAPEVEPFVIRLEDAKDKQGRKSVRILNEGPATVDKGAETRKRLLEALLATSGKTAAELAKAVDLHVNTVKAHLRALVADGAVHKRGKGGENGKADLWWLTAQ